MKKIIKKALPIALFYLIGLACIFVLSLRVEQIDNNPEYNEYSYYEYEIAHK